VYPPIVARQQLGKNVTTQWPVLANTTAARDTMTRLNSQFDRRDKQSAFVYGGMEEEEFREARDDVVIRSC
jgi:hypothetical protein